MIKVKLREAIDNYHQRTGIRFTYDSLAKITGISTNTLQSLASRSEYNTTLLTIEKLCSALGCAPEDILELTHELGDSKS